MIFGEKKKTKTILGTVMYTQGQLLCGAFFTSIVCK